ncbi:alpha-hydroxy acid oxidase [Paraburkholderia phenoliruptrix]|uniref:Alpha-hydroxy acid oxidase n=1 Tax=Paraburkholderia phenoliruptrix TaxID=252970 RepID=A0ABV3WAY3_9BURK
MNRLERALSISDLREIARKSLPGFIFEFIDGGAEDEITLARNRSAFEQTTLVPRVLNNVENPDLHTTLLRLPSAAPLLISPMGSCALACRGADVAIARAAAKRGIPYVLSSMATTSMEEVRRSVDGRLWFQLYTLKDRAFTRSLVERAKAANFEALVVTVDLPIGGKRERDLKNGVRIPMRLGISQAYQLLTHPRWALQVAARGTPQFENLRGLGASDDAGLTIAAKVGQMLDSRFDWEDLARLRDLWDGPIVVKGVQHPRDAIRLSQVGVDAIWLSNHGGRQLDGAESSFESLRAIAAAVGSGTELIIDSGIRRGVDLVKSVAVGARAVAIGRPALFGAAAGGHDGALRAIDILLDEARRAMMLCGVKTIDSISMSGLITQADAVRPSRLPEPLR